MKLLLQFSGEHEELPRAELEGVLKGEGIVYEISEEVRGKGNKSLFMLSVASRRFLDRLALLRRVSSFVAKGRDIEPLGEEIARAIRRSKKKSFAVRCSTHNMEKKFGAAIKEHLPESKVDLENPDITILCFLCKENKRYYAGIEIPLNRNFGDRRAQFRPYFSPTSMHPRIARVLVNLSQVRRGNSLLDPFCGTGGILIEAGLMDIEVSGVDYDNRAVDGCRKNLDFYKISGEIKKGDALKFKPKKKFDAVVSDLPYGRSSVTSRKDLESLYEKFLANAAKNLIKSKKVMVMMLPAKYGIKIPDDLFSVEGDYRLYVHKSLSRRIMVLKKK